jgi:hypothetical protein
MPLWLSITIAVVCWLLAMLQIRMFLIYCGKIDSPAIGFFKGQGANHELASNAIRSALKWAVFGLIFVLVHWPQSLTYITAVWASFTLVDLILLFFGTGRYSLSTFPPQVQKSLLARQVKTALTVFAFKSLFFLVSVYYLGF